MSTFKNFSKGFIYTAVTSEKSTEGLARLVKLLLEDLGFPRARSNYWQYTYLKDRNMSDEVLQQLKKLQEHYTRYQESVGEKK